jgi:predicted Zn-dependent protease
MSNPRLRRVQVNRHCVRNLFISTALLAVLPFVDSRDLWGQGHDYFTAHQHSGVRQYLASVEKHHLYTSPSNARGLVGNIAEGKYERAAGGLQYILERFPNHPRALELAGVLAKMSKNSEIAVRYFEKAIRLYPQYAVTHAQYGKFLTDIDVMDEGIKRLQHAIQLDPKLVASYVWLAKAFAKKGDAKLANETAEQARQLGYKGAILEEVSRR